MDEILAKGPFFGEQYSGIVAPGLGMACMPYFGIYKEILDLYAALSFRNSNGSLNYTTVVEHTTTILKKHGLKDINAIQNIEGVYIYPPEWFSPKNSLTNILTITPNTYTIHHYDASWLPRSKKFRRKIRHYFHLKDSNFLVKLYKFIFNKTI
jgi:hypothetical protein